ncbi:MAG: metal-sensing transcriptional repressor [Cohaesibacter sp.]|jgi:DNA-binding FrmR family transcriptional regulator|nr:metal-sensing transcriptional repressor [Cohaesibacter sp.]
MTEPYSHASHPQIIKRLKRASGHLRHVIEMIEQGEPCNDIAQQMHAVEKAITNAKRVLIQDHIDHCLEAALPCRDGPPSDEEAEILESFKAITKYL